MAKRLLLTTILNSNAHGIKPVTSLENMYVRKLHNKNVSFQELTIPVRWGHVAAKLWGGNKNGRPILALHGWQDNAGTWDPLVPQLNVSRPILAIDFPGHGLSSNIPPGMQYYLWEFPRLIYYIKNYFKWEKVSLLAHSMGSIASLRFASLFPDEVDFYVAIDSLIPDNYDIREVIEEYTKYLRKEKLGQEHLETEPRSHTLEEIEKIWHLSTKKSVSLESVQYLMKRGLRQSKTDPTKYYFSRDARLKQILFTPEGKQFAEGLVKRLKCPTLYIKPIESSYATDAFSVKMRQLLERNNKNFEWHFVPGTHHVHLNNPENIAPLIQDFLQRHNVN